MEKMAMPNTDPLDLDASGYPQYGSWADRVSFLLRQAVFAPSSHNTQPWSFRVRNNVIDLLRDETRWLRVEDDGSSCFSNRIQQHGHRKRREVIVLRRSEFFGAHG